MCEPRMFFFTFGTAYLDVQILQASYLAFKRFEPNEPWAICLLLLGVPSVICYTTGSTVTSVVYVFIQYWLLLSSISVAYRLSPIHPLAKYPGPVACKVSKFWFVYVTLQGKAHEYVHRLHGQYGEVVRIGTQAVLKLWSSLLKQQ